MTFKIDRLRAVRLPLLILTLCTGAAFAFGNDDRADKGLDHRVAQMQKELKLTEDQAARIRVILARDTVGMGAMHRDHGMNRGYRGPMGPMGPMGPLGGMGGPMMGGPEFAKQMRSAKVDTEALNKDFEEHLARMREMHAKRVANFVAIHDVLTPEQRGKAADDMEKRATNMKKSMGRPGGAPCDRSDGKSCE